MRQHEEALAAAEEAVSACRREGTASALVRALDRVAVEMGRLGRADDAREPLRESAVLRRTTPAVGNQGLVSTLIMAVWFRLCGLDAAHGAARAEAARGYRKLRDANPDDRLAAVAETLHGVVLWFVAQHPDPNPDAVAALLAAETVAGELDEAWDGIGDDAPSALYAPPVHVLSYLVDRLGPDRSTQTPAKAIEDFLDATEGGSARFLYHVAKQLERLASWLPGRGDPDTAVTLAGHAVALRRWMASDADDLWLLFDAQPRHGQEHSVLKYVGVALDLYAACLRDVGRLSDALGAAEEAVAIQERIVADHRRAVDGDRHSAAAPELGWALHLLAERLAARRELPAALDAVQEAVTGYTTLAQEWPAKFGPMLSDARVTAAEVRQALDRQ